MSSADHIEALDTIRVLYDMGAVHVKVGDIEVTFPPRTIAPVRGTPAVVDDEDAEPPAERAARLVGKGSGMKPRINVADELRKREEERLAAAEADAAMGIR